MPSLGNGFGHTKTIEKGAENYGGYLFLPGMARRVFLFIGILNEEIQVWPINLQCLGVCMSLLRLETDAETSISQRSKCISPGIN